MRIIFDFSGSLWKLCNQYGISTGAFTEFAGELVLFYKKQVEIPIQ
jgi:hypothetical protein